MTYTWLLAYKQYADPKTAATEALKDVIRFCLGDGQGMSESLGYTPQAPRRSMLWRPISRRSTTSSSDAEAP